MKLSEVVWKSLEHAVASKSGVNRFAVDGVPDGISDILLSKASSEGLCGNVLVWYVGKSGGESLPGEWWHVRKSAKLDRGGVTSIRNRMVNYITIKSAESEELDDSIGTQVVTVIPDLIDDVEQRFLSPTDHVEYVTLCNKCAVTDVPAKLCAARWSYLQEYEHTIILGWNDLLGLSGALGVPSEEEGGSMPNLRSFDTLECIATFMKERPSPDAAKQQLIDAIEADPSFDDKERYKQAIDDFFAWLVETGSWKVATDWNRPSKVYRGVKAKGSAKVAMEKNWRTILDRACWDRLLKPFAKASKQTLEVRNGHDPEVALVKALDDGASGVFPVSRDFQLCVSASQLGQRVLVPADWKFGVKPAELNFEDEECVLLSCDEPAVQRLFKSFAPVRAKTNEKSVKGALLNVSSSESGVHVFIDGADLDEEITQPQAKDAPDMASALVLKSPSAFSIVLLIDPHRFSLAGAKVEERELYCQSEPCEDGSLRIDITGVESDGILQQIEVLLRDADGGDLRLKIEVSCSGVPEGEYSSYLHLWAASHADRRKYPAKIRNEYAEKLAPLVNALEQFGGEGKPLFIGAIADVEASFPSDFKVLSNGVILDEVAVKVGAESSAVKRCPNWKLPVAVKAARGALWNLMRQISGDRPFSNIDYTNTQLVAACVKYRDAFESWINSDPDAAYDALSWMDTVHLVSSTSAGTQTSALIVLPTHPLSLVGIVGLSDLLSPMRNREGGGYDLYPPLSRLYGMAGPRSWVVKGADSTHEVFRLATPNEHVFKVYEKTGPVNEVVRAYLKEHFSLGLPTLSLALGTRDVASVLDDVCALNPAMSNFRVGIVSDPSGSVCDGIFSWFKETENSMSPESKDWAGCFPMHLSVYSSPEVIGDWDVEGRVANCSDTGARRLSWYKELPGEFSNMNFSILGELTCGESPADIGEGRGLVPSLSLFRLGVCFRQDFLLQAGGSIYVDTYGAGKLSEVYNHPTAPGAKIGSVLERWDHVLRRNHRPYSFSDHPVITALKDSKFVAIPVSTSSVIQAVSSIDSDSAIWKFEHTEFGVTDSTSGHVILTKKLEMLHQRMRDISKAYNFSLDGVGEIEALLRYMGRAGINTLHSLSDNEKVLLGALSSVAVMRSYESIPRTKPRNSEGAWPALVMPLDSFTRLLEQLNKQGSRPDFMVFEVSQNADGQFAVNIDVLEAKWRSDSPQFKQLSDMHKTQCSSFIEEMRTWFSLEGESQKKMSAVIFISELLTAAIKLRESSTGDVEFSGEVGVAKSLALTDALLKNKVQITFGDNPTLICISGDESVTANTAVLVDGRAGMVGVMGQGDAIRVLKHAAFKPEWTFLSPGDEPEGPSGDPARLPGGGANPAPVIDSPAVYAGRDIQSESAQEDAPKSSAIPVQQEVSPKTETKQSGGLENPVPSASDWPPKTNALGLVGQDAASIKVKNKSTMSVRLGRRFTDTLFVGPAGVGKSSFARAIAAEVLKEEPIFSSGSDAETPGDLISLLGSRGKIPPMKGRRKVAKCVVFIDEIHALSKKTSVFLLSALDDARLATEDGIEYDFNDVVFLGATTDKGCLTPAFLSRMDVIQLIPYSIAELAGILYVHGKRVFGGYELSRDVCEEIAIRSRCNPRKAVRNLENDMLAHLLSLVPVELDKDEALKEAGRLMTTASVSEYYQSQGVDLNGLDQTSIKALKYLEKTESASREKLRKGLQITNETDFNEVMEYLEVLRLVSTSTNGRSITNEGRKYLKAPTSLRRFM